MRSEWLSTCGYYKEFTFTANEMDEVVFLTVDEVRELHQESIKKYSPREPTDVHDYGLLESAVSTPQQTFGGERLYKSLFEMAAAYLIGLVCNHAFVNGNKRIGFAACSTFLRMNGYQLTFTQDEAVELTLGVVTYKIERKETVMRIEESARLL